MDKITYISDLLANNILVPDYQRAYSWEEKQCKQYLDDIKDYLDKDNPDYYIGHFLFEKENNKKYLIIYGQQRLTTTIIFLSSLFEKLKQETKEESFKEKNMQRLYEDIFRDEMFNTVSYDMDMFKKKVLIREKATNDTKTKSQERILKALEYFDKELKKEKYESLKKMFDIITTAKCTTHEVEKQSEAVQMFIYRNDRGKTPTDLEIIKALFMYNIHIYSEDEDKEKN